MKDLISEYGLKKLSDGVNLGFEKESLRVTNSKISKSHHPESLGSSACNQFITIDFSEAQLELITPPLEGNEASLYALDDIHHYVTKNIQDEILWPFSIPPSSISENDILIGRFGSSHEGMFKHIYRKGLANRYGKTMQAISGFHFNYSLPDNIWTLFDKKNDSDLLNTRSEIYFSLLRNLYRMNWLLIYLFGASPIINKDLAKNQQDPFLKLDSSELYLPFATSLRMSEYGYSNTERKRLNLSINSLDKYVADLSAATMTPEPAYLKYEKVEDSQLNSNMIQIEAEYYAVARPKSAQIEGIRQKSSLKKRGVEFIEIRSLDLNPFSKVGIDRDTILFLELFIIFCLTTQSKKLDKESMKTINHNDLTVAKYGRRPNLLLTRNANRVLMKSWGNEILEKMTPIAEQIDNSDEEYLTNIATMRSRLADTDETPSAQILDELNSKKINQTELGNTLGYQYKEHYLAKEKSENNLWETLDEERKQSLIKQKELEITTAESGKSFHEFKNDYYKS